MMLLIVASVVSMLVGCENGRYQIASGGQMAGVYRLDTKTGEVSICGVGLGLPSNTPKMNCVTGF
jgi:hypothetical protein